MELNGKKLTLETGEIAKQADGAVLLRYGDTVIFATAVASKTPRENCDFLPLTVEYKDKMYAAGKIPGSFFKREGRAGEKEILISRLIDRPLRPLFPKGMANDIQIICNTLSYDPEVDIDNLAIIASSAAVSISSIPFDGPVAAVTVGKIDGKLVINPSRTAQEGTELSLIMAGTAESIVMVEAGSSEISEDEMVEALILGHEEIKKIVALQVDLVAQAGKEKFEVVVVDDTPSDDILAIKEEYYEKIKVAALTKEKMERSKNLGKVFAEAKEKHNLEDSAKISTLKGVFDKVEREAVRNSIVTDGIRGDGRGIKDVRPISIKLDLLPRVHGSALFTRGETQALVTTTLGTSVDAQRLDDLSGKSEKKFLLHYNFPGYCVGEVKNSFGPARREIGHGALAERAITGVLPNFKDFEYTIRIVSEIMESNGSSSMATVCGGSLALMSAGVPTKGSVAGIAMGLVMEGENTVVLSDITGQEDHLGDMDFKVAGTKNGITALQMDIKTKGVTKALMKKALEQAREGRLHILSVMDESIGNARTQLSEFAPVITKIMIDKEKIGTVIGPGGKMIRKIVEATQASIEIQDDGTVVIGSSDKAASKKAIEMIEALTKDAEVGMIYEGKVKKIMDFGAFVEILPGKDGLVHISQLADERVEKVTDILNEGDIVQVKVLEIDRQGKIRLSRKDALKELGK